MLYTVVSCYYVLIVMRTGQGMWGLAALVHRQAYSEEEEEGGGREKGKEQEIQREGKRKEREGEGERIPVDG